MKCQCGWEGELATVDWWTNYAFAHSEPLCLLCRCDFRRKVLGRAGVKVTTVTNVTEKTGRYTAKIGP